MDNSMGGASNTSGSDNSCGVIPNSSAATSMPDGTHAVVTATAGGGGDDGASVAMAAAMAAPTNDAIHACRSPSGTVALSVAVPVFATANAVADAVAVAVATDDVVLAVTWVGVPGYEWIQWWMGHFQAGQRCT